MSDRTGFLNKLTEYMNDAGLQVSTEGVMLIIFAVAVVVAVLLWLGLRRCRLWYWKVDIQADRLERIDNRLKNIEEGFVFPTVKEGQEEEASMKEEYEEYPGESEECEKDTARKSDTYYVGKSGKVYTEEELEAQIRY